MKIVHISDTHGFHSQVDLIPCDLVIHTGDFSDQGHQVEVLDFFDWFNQYPSKYKVVIAGNHDISFDIDLRGGKELPEYVYEALAKYECSTNFYLENSGCEIEGIKIWGSPVTPSFGKGWAFNKERGRKIRDVWNDIPGNIDILLTHSPAKGLLDEFDGLSVGCEDLFNWIHYYSPQYHLCGHIHETHGLMSYLPNHTDGNGTIISNASICNEQYKPVNKPNIIHYNK